MTVARAIAITSRVRFTERRNIDTTLISRTDSCSHIGYSSVLINCQICNFFATEFRQVLFYYRYASVTLTWDDELCQNTKNLTLDCSEASDLMQTVSVIRSNNSS
jgi:hypothetical protein